MNLALRFILGEISNPPRNTSNNIIPEHSQLILIGIAVIPLIRRIL
jgi:hypothetical protein